MKKLPVLFFFLPALGSFAQNTGYVPDQLIVQLAPGASMNSVVEKVEAAASLEILEYRCISEIMNIYVLRFPADVNISELCVMLPRTSGEIRIVQKNHYVYERETLPSDTLFDNLWHLKNTGQTGGIVDADIDAPEAWDITTGGLTTHGDTIVVCIIEGSGVDINHVDIKNNHWKNYGEIENDGLDNDNNGYVDDYNGWNIQSDDDAIGAGSHGTRVAGMIGATGNNVTGMTGVNWDVKLMVVQGQQASDEATVIEAYSYPLKMRKMYNESLGLQGAFVVATNSSWGIDNGDPADSPLWCAMYDSLGAYGILNIAATTNSNANVDVVGDLPTTCTSEFLVGVTMTNSQDLRAGSGYGTTHVDLGAPGSSIQSTAPGNFYTFSSGTSFATPCVAGCVALAYSSPCTEFINLVKYDPAQAALDMRAYILNSVDQTPGLLAEVSSGGRVNVKNAIDSIIATCDPNLCAAPYNLVAANLTDSAADISWQGFATDYVAYLQEGSSTLVQIDMTGTSTFNVDTLKPCTWYTVYIQANCGADSSNFSFPLIFETDGCCDNPGLVLDSKTNSSLTVSWSPILYATNYDIHYKLSSESVWTELTGVTSPYTFSGLLQCGSYDFEIHTTCTDSTHGYGATHTFTTLGCGACTEKAYCDVTGADADLEWIESFSLNGFSLVTGNNGGWFQSNGIVSALTPGDTYPITIVPGYQGANFTESFSVWIDLDQDGVFDASEAVVNDVVANTTINSSIAIPAGTAIGITKMRMAMRYQDPAEACPGESFYGEFEDYCVYIGPQTGLEENQFGLSVYPNPVRDELYIRFDGSISSVRIFDRSGKLVLLQEEFDGTPISTGILTSGLYFIEVQSAEVIYRSKFIKS